MKGIQRASGLATRLATNGRLSAASWNRSADMQMGLEALWLAEIEHGYTPRLQQDGAE